MTRVVRSLLPLLVLATGCASGASAVGAAVTPPHGAGELRQWEGYLRSLEAFLALPLTRVRGLALLEARARLAEHLSRARGAGLALPRPLETRAGRLLLALDALYQRAAAAPVDAAAGAPPALPTLRLSPVPPLEAAGGVSGPQAPHSAAAALDAAAPGGPTGLVPEPDAQISEHELDDGGPAVDIVPPPPEPGSFFRWPLASARVTSRFGYRSDPIHGRRGFHDGVDLSAAQGTLVLAAARGRVTFAGRRGGAGNLVVLRHDNGSKTLYAHLERILVAPGAQVAASAPVGLVGATGRATGPHLHFVVRWSGKLVDPLQVVGKSARQLAARLEP